MNGVLRLWEVPSGKLLGERPLDGDGVTRFSPDGRVVAAAANLGVRLLDGDTLAPLPAGYLPHPDPITGRGLQPGRGVPADRPRDRVRPALGRGHPQAGRPAGRAHRPDPRGHLHPRRQDVRVRGRRRHRPPLAGARAVRRTGPRPPGRPRRPDDRPADGRQPGAGLRPGRRVAGPAGEAGGRRQHGPGPAAAGRRLARRRAPPTPSRTGTPSGPSGTSTGWPSRGRTTGPSPPAAAGSSRPPADGTRPPRPTPRPRRLAPSPQVLSDWLRAAAARTRRPAARRQALWNLDRAIALTPDDWTLYAPAGADLAGPGPGGRRRGRGHPPRGRAERRRAGGRSGGRIRRLEAGRGPVPNRLARDPAFPIAAPLPPGRRLSEGRRRRRLPGRVRRHRQADAAGRPAGCRRARRNSAARAFALGPNATDDWTRPLAWIDHALARLAEIEEGQPDAKDQIRQRGTRS